MVAAIDLTGRRFGKLVVEEREGSRRYALPSGKAYCVYAVWRCRCDCGGTISTTSRCLISGRTASCGCLRKETRFPEGQAITRYLGMYVNNAKRRKLEWALNDKQFITLITSPCYYTGRLPNRLTSYRGSSALVNGIDRKDPNIGYTYDNCVPCCFEINRAKSDISFSGFLALIKDAATNLKLVN